MASDDEVLEADSVEGEHTEASEHGVDEQMAGEQTADTPGQSPPDKDVPSEQVPIGEDAPLLAPLSDQLKGVPNVVFPNDVLLKKIVEKHKKYISELESDIEATMKRIEELEETIRENKKEIEREKTLISVLTEKPKQLCHQISVMRANLMKSLLDADPELAEELKQPMAQLEEFEDYIEKHVIEPEEGLRLSKDAMPAYELIRERLAAQSSLSEQLGAVDAIVSKMNDVVNSYTQLVGMAGSQNGGYAHLVEELEEARGHLSWASNRLRSHEGALMYWQQEAAGEGVEV